MSFKTSMLIRYSFLFISIVILTSISYNIKNYMLVVICLFFVFLLIGINIYFS